MNIPDEIVEQIRQSTDIVDIIGEVVELRKRGGNFVGKCPFHNEKTPSFTVSQDKGIFKCFGCGKSGNVITFMIEYHGLSFLESVKELAKKVGIRIPDEPTSKKAKEQLSRNELALKALEAASAYFIKLTETTAGKTAISYFNKRGLSKDIIRSFGLGYSSDSWDSLIRELRRQGFSDAAINDAGLTVENDNGGIYDRFRGRIMFPVHNFMGKVIGFGARILTDDPNQPKYINSPQTLVYDKSRSLYGLFQAKNELRNKKAVILVEGYLDVLTLHQAGYGNTVASSGTALTKEQLEIISKYCKNLYIVYDADSAGIKAAERGLELALAQGFDIHIVRLPAGEDPDSLIRQHGSGIFQAYLKDAASFVDFKIDILKKEGELDSPSGKANTIRSILKLISTIPDRLQHNDHISRLAALLKVSEFELHKIYEEKAAHEKKLKKDNAPAQASNISTPKNTKQSNRSTEIDNVTKISEKSLLPEELMILHAALTDINALKLITKNLKISQDHFFSTEGKRLFGIIYKINKPKKDVLSSIISDESINNEDKNFLTTLAIKDNKPSDNWNKFGRELPEANLDRIIMDAVYKLELLSLEKSLVEIQGQIKTMPFEEQKILLEKYKMLSERKTLLYKNISS